jgi:hypothetical protein
MSILATLCGELPLQMPFMKHPTTRFILIFFLVPQAPCPDSSRGVRSCRFSPYFHSERPLDSVGGRSVCQKTSSHSVHIARRPAGSPIPKHSTCLFRHQILHSLSVTLTGTTQETFASLCDCKILKCGNWGVLRRQRQGFLPSSLPPFLPSFLPFTPLNQRPKLQRLPQSEYQDPCLRPTKSGGPPHMLTVLSLSFVTWEDMRENYDALSIHNNNKDKHLEHSSIHLATYYAGFWRRCIAGLVMPDVSKSHNVFVFRGPLALHWRQLNCPFNLNHQQRCWRNLNLAQLCSQSTECRGACRLVAAITNLAVEH